MSAGSDRSDSEEEELGTFVLSEKQKAVMPKEADWGLSSESKEIDFASSPVKENGKRALPAPDKVEEPPVKKAKVGAKEQIDFSTESNNTPNTSSFVAETANLKDFCNVLLGIGNLPNLEYMFLKFNSDGMMLYGKPASSPAMALSFWNKQMFDKYHCPTTVKLWVSRNRMEGMRKQISKNVMSVKITQIVNESYAGLCFSGSMNYDTGGKSVFDVNVFEQDACIPVLEPNVVFDWHITTSSQKLFDNVKWIDNSGEFVSFMIDRNRLTLEGLNDAAIVSDRISHDAENSTTAKFQCILLQRYLKVVTSTHDLHKSVTISFNPDNKNNPLLFSYPLDQASPQSHFSVYLVPCDA